MDFPKIAGWLILAAGLVIIGWTLMSSYNIFTGQTSVPELFKVPTEKVLSQDGSQDLEAQFEQIIGEQIKGLVPSDSLPTMFNLGVSSMLAFILIFGGAQIAGLGIKLIKK